METNESNRKLVENIRFYGSKKGLSLTKIEEALKFGNGSIGKWIKASRKAPLDRIMAIADYLEVPVEALTGEPLKQKNPVTQMDDEALMFALFGDSDVVTGEDLQAVKNYATFLKEKKERGD